MLSTVMKNCCICVRQRWIFAIMGFLALVMAYGMRVSLSITITEMVYSIKDEVESEDKCPIVTSPLPSANGTHKFHNGAERYAWSEKTQGIILSSFYWGYVVTQLPGALLAEKFGGKHVLGFGILSTAILTILTPAAVRHGQEMSLVVLRVLMGIGEGVTLPALNVMLSQWTPPDERSKTGSFVYVGAPLGTVFATIISGLILDAHSWPVVFYFFGGIGIVWYLLWIVLCYSTPSDHPFISYNESIYLNEQMSQHVHKKPAPVPWRHLLKSMPLWALIAVQVGHDWGFYTMASDLPKFMKDVLNLPVATNAYASSLPYVGMWLCCSLTSWLADWLITNKHLSITGVRKLGTTIASIGPAFFLVAAAYSGCETVLVITMFTLGITLLGCGIPSLKVNALDLSPNYSGTVMAISNGIASCTGIITPYLVGELVKHKRISEWRIVFWIIFGILLATNAFFLLFASGEIEDWNDPVLMKQQKQERRKNKEHELEKQRKMDA